MSKAKLYESVSPRIHFLRSFTNRFLRASVFSSHFFRNQHPRQTKNTPTRYTHFGMRHARSIPTPTAIRMRPHSQFVGAPLHLLRIPSPPFSIFMPKTEFLCKQKAAGKCACGFYQSLDLMTYKYPVLMSMVAVSSAKTLLTAI